MMFPIKGKSAPYIYGDIEYDSKEEIYFSWWLEELIQQGFIEKYIYQPKMFVLSDKYTYEVLTQMKTKVRSDIRTLLQPHTYSPDYKIYWTSAAEGVFHRSLTSGQKLDLAFISMMGRTLVDVKPSYDMHDSARRFQVSQKWIMQKFGIYIQKKVIVPRIHLGRVIPKSALFEVTFAPERYRFTNVKMKSRKEAFRYKTFEQFIEGE